jgi:hypothetical protein
MNDGVDDLCGQSRCTVIAIKARIDLSDIERN